MALQPLLPRAVRAPMRFEIAIGLGALLASAIFATIGLASPASSPVVVEAGREATNQGSAPRPSAPATSPMPAWENASGASLTLDGRVAFWQARVDDAAEDYLSALQLVDALLDRSRATGVLADLDRASAVLAAAEAGAPSDDAGFSLRRGQLAFALHDFVGARAAAERALELDPGDLGGLALLGDAALEQGDYTVAWDAYADLAAEGQSPAILARLARLAWLTGDAIRAEELLVQAVRAAEAEGVPDRLAFHHFQLGELLRSGNQVARAAEAYEAALAVNPDHVPSMGGLALARAAEGRRAEATALLEDATARMPSPDLVAALGDLYALDGDIEAAERQWTLVERIADTGRANGGAYDRQLVLFRADHGRSVDEAVAIAEAELAARTDVYAYDSLAWALYRAGRLPEADAAASEAMRLATPDGRIFYHAGLIAEALGRRDDARELLTRAASASAALPPLQVVTLEAALERVGEP